MCQHLEKNSWCWTTATMWHLDKEPLSSDAWKHMTYRYNGRQLWEQQKPECKCPDWLIQVYFHFLATRCCLCLQPGATQPGSTGSGDLQDTSIMEHEGKLSHNCFCLLYMLMKVFRFDDSTRKRPRLHFRWQFECAIQKSPLGSFLVS